MQVCMLVPACISETIIRNTWAYISAVYWQESDNTYRADDLIYCDLFKYCEHGNILLHGPVFFVLSRLVSFDVVTLECGESNG